jgi:AraC family transcriptional regulator
MGHDLGARWQQTGPRPVFPHQPQLSSGSAWKGFRVFQGHRDSSGEVNDVAPTNHLVCLVTRGGNAVEGAWWGERWRRWISFPNSVSILPANAPLALRWRGGFEFIEVELERGFFEANIVDADQQPSSLELRPQIPTEIPAIQRIVLNLRDDLVGGMPTGRLYGESLAMALASHLFKAGASAESVKGGLRGGLGPNRLKCVIDYINDRLGEDLRIQELAQVCSMSCAHFARRFKESMGVAPHQYVTARRIERARELLVGSELPLAEIALRSGFAAQSGFTTTFRRATGTTPYAFRRGAQP